MTPIITSAKTNKNKPKIYAKTIRLKNGLLMCANKKNKPKLSSKTIKWHMDTECCLDPHEIPNPMCYYPTKYQKLINKYNLKFKRK